MRKTNLSPEQIRRRDERKKRFADLTKRIAEMSDDERAEFAAKLPVVVTCEGHPLSLRNTMLLAFQNARPLTVVGGFRQWLKQGRCVRKGEHGSTILVPCGGKKPNSMELPDDAQGATIRTFFVGGTVFDISQTDVIESVREARAGLIPSEETDATLPMPATCEMSLSL